MFPTALQFKWKIEVCLLYQKVQSTEAQSLAHQGCESSFGRRCLRQGSSISRLLPGKNQDALVCHCPKAQGTGTLCAAQMGCNPSWSLLLCSSMRRPQLTCGEQVWESYGPLPAHHHICPLTLGKSKSPAELQHFQSQNWYISSSNLTDFCKQIR